MIGSEPTGAAVSKAAQTTHTHNHAMTYESFEQSVLDHADEHGNLTYSEATRLLKMHKTTWEEAYNDVFGFTHWPRMQACHAQTLLEFLGY